LCVNKDKMMKRIVNRAMNKRPAMNASRRAFLQRGSALIAAGVTAPIALNLAAISEASAATAADYKAIVCVFMGGGNDNSNSLVPYDNASYATYQSPILAYAQSALTPTLLTPRNVPIDRNGVPHQYALSPSLAPLKAIFDAGRLGVIQNVGTLVLPTSKTQYTNRTVPLPPRLFSHNDQQSIWQSLAPEGAPSGWGGRMGDLFEAGNGKAIFTSVNISENTVFPSGKKVTQYQVSPTGAQPLYGLDYLYGSMACSEALRTLVTQPRTHLFENEHNMVTKRAIIAGNELTAALAGAQTINTVFPVDNKLGDQLKFVAKMIASADALTVKRQVFFVSLGGFDHHDGLLTKQPGLLKQVADAMRAFYDATVELGVANQVTSFTASDFGRSLVGNNDGSDHGWGSAHFMMGGAVLGGNYYGTSPVVANDGPDDVGEGRLLPTTSVDQYAATIGKWFGATDAQLLDILPNLKNFNASTRNLGFV
jgi:uncharacterized protein (DUF1501 family)